VLAGVPIEVARLLRQPAESTIRPTRPRLRRFARVGILNYAGAQDTRVSELRDGIRELGYVEGQDLAITYRGADGRPDRLPDLAGSRAVLVRVAAFG